MSHVINPRHATHYPEMDVRALFVECPQHRGVLLPVTEMRVSRTRLALRIYLAAVCRYCHGQTHFVRIREGVRSPEPFPWNA